jgi:hypothetical protein
MFSKSTCINESHNLQSSQQVRKSIYHIKFHTTPQTLQVANLVALESLPHIEHNEGELLKGYIQRWLLEKKF